MDLSKIKKVYVIGIKGSGIIAVVEILKNLGIEITGSDTSEKFFTDAILKRLGIKYFEGFSIENIPNDADLILYSSSYNTGNNIELREIVKRNLPMASYPEILAEIFNKKFGIAVCGTHGKTTTSAMLAYILEKCGKDPGAVIGSRVKNWEGNSLSGQGEYFVIEADEFQNKLKLYEPKAVILTSVDWDHPDTYPTFDEYKKAFSGFVAKIPKAGFLVVWGDSVATNEVACSSQCEIIKYGFQEDNDVKISNIQYPISNKIPNPKSQSTDKIQAASYKLQSFNLIYSDKNLGSFEIQLVGKHNVLNAAAVIAVCYKLNLDMEKVREALRDFQGTARRFEYIGMRNGAILIDDYGHHPEEIKATLQGAREIYPDKDIIAVFHPHSFTRTEAMLSEFSQSFADADKVIVLDIYGSAREEHGNVNSGDLVKLINKYDRNKAQYLPTISETVKYLENKIGQEDIVLCIGAGNVWEVAEKLKEK